MHIFQPNIVLLPLEDGGEVDAARHVALLHRVVPRPVEVHRRPEERDWKQKVILSSSRKSSIKAQAHAQSSVQVPHSVEVYCQQENSVLSKDQGKCNESQKKKKIRLLKCNIKPF